jgi:hypothetical protein
MIIVSSKIHFEMHAAKGRRKTNDAEAGICQRAKWGRGVARFANVKTPKCLQSKGFKAQTSKGYA